MAWREFQLPDTISPKLSFQRGRVLELAVKFLRLSWARAAAAVCTSVPGIETRPARPPQLRARGAVHAHSRPEPQLCAGCCVWHTSCCVTSVTAASWQSHVTQWPPSPSEQQQPRWVMRGRPARPRPGRSGACVEETESDIKTSLSLTRHWDTCTSTSTCSLAAGLQYPDLKPIKYPALGCVCGAWQHSLFRLEISFGLFGISAPSFICVTPVPAAASQQPPSLHEARVCNSVASSGLISVPILVPATALTSA